MKKQSKVARVELRPGGGRHGAEKPGRSVGGMIKVARKFKNQHHKIRNE